MKKENHVFKSLHVAHLSHDSAMSLFRSTYEIAIPVRSHIGATADAILTELVADTDACFAQLFRQRKSVLTDDVKALRKNCNDLFAEIKRTISYCVKSSNENLNMAGKDLKLFLRPNWNMQKNVLPTQIEITINFIDKYRADPELVAAGEVIGVNKLMTELETTNLKLEKIYLDRNTEVGSRPVSGTHLRPAANDSYMQFCTAIEQAARYTPNDELHSLFNQMNELRKTTHKLVAGKKKEVSNNK